MAGELARPTVRFADSERIPKAFFERYRLLMLPDLPWFLSGFASRISFPEGFLSISVRNIADDTGQDSPQIVYSAGQALGVPLTIGLMVDILECRYLRFHVNALT